MVLLHFKHFLLPVQDRGLVGWRAEWVLGEALGEKVQGGYLCHINPGTSPHIAPLCSLFQAFDSVLAATASSQGVVLGPYADLIASIFEAGYNYASSTSKEPDLFDENHLPEGPFWKQLHHFMRGFMCHPTVFFSQLEVLAVFRVVEAMVNLGSHSVLGKSWSPDGVRMATEEALAVLFQFFFCEGRRCFEEQRC